MSVPAPRFARRMADIAPFRVMELLAGARQLEAQGRDIIHMEVGEPDFPTPQPVLEAATRFIAGGKVQYTPAAGLPELREAIARHYHDRFGADVEPERIIVTPGASGALTLILAASTNPGDGWLLPDPGYPCNRHIVRSFEGVPQPLPVDASTRFQPTSAQLAGHWQPDTLGVIVATPSNPTGTLLDGSELSALHHTVAGRDGLLVVDEIYQGLNYGVAPSTVLADPVCNTSDRLFVVNSFSKYFGMTGWRLGWLVAPRGWVSEIEKLAQHFFISAPTASQHAALAAFSPATRDILESRRAAFAERRNTLLPALRSLGLRVDAEPHGAFYIYADISAVSDDSQALARRLIEEAGVATTPGIDFGDNRARQHLRLAYTTRNDRLLEAAERMQRLLRQP
jgi:aspartate/methionine/tyrosine aminotransferase